MFTTRRYTNPRLPLPLPLNCYFQCATVALVYRKEYLVMIKLKRHSYSRYSAAYFDVVYDDLLSVSCRSYKYLKMLQFLARPSRHNAEYSSAGTCPPLTTQPLTSATVALRGVFFAVFCHRRRFASRRRHDFLCV